MRYRVGALGVLLVFASVSTLQAADVVVPAASASSSDWIVTIGGDVRGIPRYPGSNAFDTAGAPYFDMARPGSPEKFHGPIDGLGFAVFDNRVIALGPVGNIIWARDPNDSSTINGLAGVGATLNIGGFVDYWAVPWLRSRAEVMQGIRGRPRRDRPIPHGRRDPGVAGHHDLGRSAGALRHLRNRKPLLQRQPGRSARLPITGVSCRQRLAGARRRHPAEVSHQPDLGDLHVC